MSDEKLTAETTFFWNDGTVSEEIARIGPDGVWVNPDLPVDEAARKFLDIVHEAWGAHFTRAAVGAERQRIRAAIEAVMSRHYERYAAGFDSYDEGAIDALDFALHAIDGEETSHE
jgi:hypothetical protein